MADLKLKFKMPDDETLAKYISIKGEKGEKGDPTKLSQLENDKGFITNDTSTLKNYYTKSQTYTKAETDDLLDNKADESELDSYYTKTETDDLIDGLGVPDGFFDGSEAISGFGAYITLNNTIYAPLDDVAIYGNAIQDGTPTTSEPVPIQVVTGEQIVEIRNKNLLKPIDGTYTDGGITVTVSGGKITVTGDSGQWDRNVWIPVEEFTVNGDCTLCLNKKAPEQAAFRLTKDRSYSSSYNFAGTYFNLATDNTKRETASNKTYNTILIYVNKNRSNLNFTLEPQLELGSTATGYVEHQKQSYEIDLGSIELCRVEDSRDHIYKDGSEYKIRRNIGKIESYNGESITTSYFSTTGELSTGATVYYILDTPIDEGITDQNLIVQLDQLGSARSYDEITTIATSGSIPALLSVKAFKDNWASTITFLSTELEKKADSLALDNYYTKSEIDSYINVKLHGVAGDGVTDDTTAIQALIDNNPHRTLFFPDGVYLISAPLVIRTDNEYQVNFKLTGNAVIRASVAVESLVEIGRQAGSWKRYQEGAIVTIDGGIFDATNAGNAFYLSSNRKCTKLMNLSILNVEQHGIYISVGTNTSNSSDADIANVSISGTGSGGEAVGLYLAGYDNKISRCRINACKIAVYDLSGNFYTDVHCLASWPSGTLNKENYEKTIAFKFSGGGVSKLNQCYADTFGVGFEFNTAQRIYLENCQSYHYLSNLDFDTILFKNNEQYANLRLYVRDFDYTPPSIGDGANIGLDLSANNNNFRQFLTTFECFKFNDINIINQSSLSEDDYIFCRSLYSGDSFTIRPAWTKTMEANKYYPIAILKGASWYDLTISMATDQQIRANFINGASPTIKVTNLGNHSHTNQYSLAICNYEIVNGVWTAYLCIKTTGSDCYFNPSIKGFTNWNNQLITRGASGATPLENPTVVAEASFNPSQS